MTRILVYSKKNFPDAVEENLGTNTAYIQINNFGDTDFYLKESSQVCCLNFDDLTEKSETSFNKFDAIKILNFIDNNLGRDFIICCPAGLSRSQAICRFMMDSIEIYKNCITNSENPCITPNYYIVTTLKRIDIKRMCLAR